MEEALLEMDFAGVTMRRVEDITEALWGSRLSPSTVRELHQKVAGQIEAWHNQPTTARTPASSSSASG